MSIAIFNYGKGGTGNAALNITAYAAVGSLPGSADEGALAVITATALGAVFVSAAEPSAPSSGDVWVLTGGDSLAPIIFTDEVTLFPRVVYQYSGAAWVLLESYVFTSSAWMEVTLAIYNSGEDILATLQETDTGGLNTGYVHYVKEAAAIHFYGSSGSLVTRKFCVTTEPVDLTDINTIRITYDRTTYTGAMTLIIGASIGMATASAALTTGTNRETVLDVSAYSGLFYIGTYINNGASQQNAGYIRKLELEV